MTRPTEAEKAAQIVNGDHVVTESEIDSVPEAFAEGDAHADGPDA